MHPLQKLYEEKLCRKVAAWSFGYLLHTGKEKFILLEIQNEWLPEDKYHISNMGADKVVITSKNEWMPENYIEVEQHGDTYSVQEIHRDESSTLFETVDKCEASLAASVACIRLFCPSARDERVDILKEYVDSNDKNRVKCFLENNLARDTYQVNEEEWDRVSLLEHDKRADVKYRGRFLVQDAKESRAYAVMYRYARKLEYIRGWYEKNAMGKYKNINRETLEQLYMR
jgi:hypothetical protein